MDRMHPSARSPFPGLAEVDSQVGQGSFSPPRGDTPCAIFAPLHYEPNYAYPLIVWLHGSGNDERQLARIMPLVSMRNFVAVAPQAVVQRVGGKRSQVWPQTWDQIQESTQRIFDAVETVGCKYNFSSRRVFLAGFDAGGTMALRVALRYPERFAGVLSLCGPFPRGQNPLGCLTRLRNLPVFLAVGRDSRQYGPTEVCDDLRLLHTAGLSITLRQYPCDHELSPQMLCDVDRWIIEQITAPKAEEWDSARKD
ncbi:MAG: hypothetical protein JW818_02055 [Pirellulales bacterium]|nr:hypothetical protein [Pirellulales bacterium]